MMSTIAASGLDCRVRNAPDLSKSEAIGYKSQSAKAIASAGERVMSKNENAHRVLAASYSPHLK